MIRVIEKICGEIGCGAYGCGKISFIPSGERTEQELLDGGRLVKFGAVIRVCGYDSEDVLLEELEGAVKEAEALSGQGITVTEGETQTEILGIRGEFPVKMTERCEDGFKSFEVRCFIWAEEK